MQSIFDFIAIQPEIAVNKIYGSSDPDNQSSPWACKAIFSSLSALSKNYVFRCLSIHEPLTTADLEKWVKPELKHLHLKAVDELIKLRILVECYSDEATLQKLQMNSYFRRGFQYSLCNPIEPWCNTSASALLKPDKKAPSHRNTQTGKRAPAPDCFRARTAGKTGSASSRWACGPCTLSIFPPETRR